MESWRLVWRDGYGKVLPLTGLLRLRDWLRDDDQRLTQGTTTLPPPLLTVMDWPCEKADPIGCAAMVNWDRPTVGEVEEAFAKACFDADQLLGEPAACRWCLNWVDDTPREQMRAELLREVELTLEERGWVRLAADLAAALAADPTDDTLRCAVADWMAEHGSEEAAAAAREGAL